jgi:myo-inositol-1(or 4)-monophosphatase
MMVADLAELEARRRVATAAALEAGRALRQYFGKPLESRLKQGGSMVSAADHAAEDILREWVAREFPGDSILAEEGGFVPGDQTWCWTLDGLDGTQNFLAGIPLFAVALAVLMERSPAVAVIHDPVRQVSYTAHKGGGAWCENEPIRVNPHPLDPSSLIAVRHRFLRREADRIYDALPSRKFRSLGSMSIELAYTASGALAGLVANRPHLWDIAPGVLLIEEGGGSALSFDGSAIFPLGHEPGNEPDRRYRIAAGNPTVVTELVAHLRDLPL